VSIRFASALPSSLAATCFQAVLGEAALAPSWNIQPGDHARAVRRIAGSSCRQLDVLCWGLMPKHVKSGRQRNRLATICVDQVTVSRITKAAFSTQRCLVPATAYYEMAERPQAVESANRTVMAIAAVWDSWRNPNTGVYHEGFTLITRQQEDAAAPPVPLVIHPPDWRIWLGEEATSARALLRAPQADSWRRWPISRRILNTDDDDPELLTPFLEEQRESPARHAMRQCC